MEKLFSKLKKYLPTLLFFAFLFLSSKIYAAPTLMPTLDIGFTPPNLSTVLSFAVKFFFSLAAVFAMLYLLWGAFSWVTSSGDKENVQKAQQKIQAAVTGLILIILVIAIAVTFEVFIFKQKICFGLTCDIKIPSLIQ